MSNSGNVTVAKQNNPMEYGSTPQENAQGAGRARAKRQQDANMSFKGGKQVNLSSFLDRISYGKSPDSPKTGYSPYPTFQSSGLSPQNSNSSSKDGNTNVAVGNEQSKYDICAKNPAAPVCAGTGITISQPKPSGGGKRRKTIRKKSKKNTSKQKKSKKRKSKKNKSKGIKRKRIIRKRITRKRRS